MEFRQVAGAREMNRAPGLYQMGDRGKLCASSLGGFSLPCWAHEYDREDTYM